MTAQAITTGPRDRWLVATVLSVTLGLFTAACCLPAVDKHRDTDGGALQDTYSDAPVLGPGWVDLAFGWLSGSPAWLANPALALGVVLLLCGRARGAAAAGIVSAALGLATWARFGKGDLYAGYYCWQASQLVFAAGVCLGCLRRRADQEPQSGQESHTSTVLYSGR